MSLNFTARNPRVLEDHMHAGNDLGDVMFLKSLTVHTKCGLGCFDLVNLTFESSMKICLRDESGLHH